MMLSSVVAAYGGILQSTAKSNLSMAHTPGSLSGWSVDPDTRFKTPAYDALGDQRVSIFALEKAQGAQDQMLDRLKAVVNSGYIWMFLNCACSARFVIGVRGRMTKATAIDFLSRTPSPILFDFSNTVERDHLLECRDSLSVNSTNTDPYGNSPTDETNINGPDSLRFDTILIKNWLFHGHGSYDCLAPKGISTNIVISSMTCVSGGIAFGSLGQYVQAADYIYNVTAINISVTQDDKPLTGGSLVRGGAYLQSWVGHAERTPPPL